MTYVDSSSIRDIKGRYSELKRAAEAIMGRWRWSKRDKMPAQQTSVKYLGSRRLI